jgi:response regulator RpfG family c-di-GMP phosphodiesterase
MDITTLSSILGERTIPNVALQLDKESFSYVYRYVMRYILRNQRTACKALLTLRPAADIDEQLYKDECDRFGEHAKDSLRKSDILMKIKFNQYFIFLTDIREDYIDKVLNNLIGSWHEKNGRDISVTFETEFVGNGNSAVRGPSEIRVVVVDDDTANLKMAGTILSKAGFYVTALKSGSALLKYVEENTPDLILLDIMMPEMDGFETMKRLKTMETSASEIPVVFLTSDESDRAESTGLSLGAMDFIKKPFVPEVLALRVRHIIELVTLQKDLSYEVERKTRENRSLFMHVVTSLADAIDAKDTYTNGHSGRVAEYSKEIARRTGYTVTEQNDIYMMGLLHDVGKIGVPDAVINKPAKLTDEEFELIKNHPVMGAKILQNIKEMPKLATGARWHHERYGGGGYPDGLSGTEIPEEARIIAVADAYDAMSSRRSYRDVLPQSTVRAEIERGRGTQFDPRFADIMLTMIDEDTDYNMREK